MDVLVAGGRDEQEVEGGCERICSTACGVVSPVDRQESDPSPVADSPASSSGADEAAADEVCTIPAEAEGFSARDSETRETAAEGDSRGELTEVIKLPGVDDVHPEATTEVIGEEDTSAPDDDSDDESEPDDDTPGGNSAEGEAADEQVVPQLTQQALESLLDESTGKLVALEDFECEVDDKAFENEWLGKHTPISLAVFGAELAKTGKCTFHVDETGKLLSDAVTYRLVPKWARITLCVHRDLSEDQKKDFILRLQARERRRTGKENRELDRRTIEAWLALGMTYETIAEMAGVSPNTVRNIEKRAAADPNSKLANTKRDRRLTWSTPENIAEAHRLRAEGKNNSQIAKALGTTPATIGKLFKDRGPRATAKIAEEPKTSSETAPDQSPPPPSHVDTTRVPDDGIPNVVRLHLEHRGLRGVLAANEYAKLLKPQQDEARETVEAIAKFDDQLLPSFLYHQAAAALLEAELEKQLLAAGKAGAA